MSDWLRWVIVALGLVLIVAMVAYARGERQRGETDAAIPIVTVITDGVSLV